MSHHFLESNGTFQPGAWKMARLAWVAMALLAVIVLTAQFITRYEFADRFLTDYSTEAAASAGERLVVEIYPGSLSEKAGLLEGDTLIAVNGQSLAGMSVEQYRAAVWASRGQAVLNVRGADGALRDVTLVDDTRPQRMMELAVGYLQGLVLAAAAMYAFARWGRRFAVWTISLCLLWFGVGQPLAYRAEFIYQFVNSLGLTLGLLGILIFPNARFYPRAGWVLAAAGALFYFLYFVPAISPYDWPPALHLGVQVILFGGAMLLLYLRYRQNATPAEKGQIRRAAGSLLAGLAIFVVVYLISMAAGNAIDDNATLYLLYRLLGLLGYAIPGIGVALALRPE